MLNLFLDTSAFVKLFHVERGSTEVISLVTRSGVACHVAELARVEFLSAMHRKLRNREIDSVQIKIALDDFERTWQALHVEHVGSGGFLEAASLISRFGRTHGIRALDALQLATFVLAAERDWQLVAADDVVVSVARAMGYPVINPLEEKG